MDPNATTGDPMTSMNVSLPESLRRFAEKRAAAGYSSVSEYFRELLRLDRKRAAEERLEELLLEGLDSGEPIEVTKEYWEKKRRDLEARLNRKATTE
jgi:antitoxin ParD1/3/4